MTKAIACVFLPREHLPFIREWCVHHLNQGWKIYLYDNTGSTGSDRKSSAFADGVIQKTGYDKRGRNYGKHTAHLSDSEVSLALARELSDLDVTVIPWQPTNAEGRIVHGQVEAYVDFIYRFRNEIDWGAFIDADEYLWSSGDFSWDDLLDKLNEGGHHRVMLYSHVYESRWDDEDRPRALAQLRSSGMDTVNGKPAGCKNIVRLDKVVKADIHWMWRTEGEKQTNSADPSQFHFRHYKGTRPEIRLVQSPLLRTLEDESLIVHLPGEQSGGAKDEGDGDPVDHGVTRSMG